MIFWQLKHNHKYFGFLIGAFDVKNVYRLNIWLLIVKLICYNSGVIQKEIGLCSCLIHPVYQETLLSFAIKILGFFFA